jgi:hypothetical protein
MTCPTAHDKAVREAKAAAVPSICSLECKQSHRLGEHSAIRHTDSDSQRKETRDGHS